MKADTEAHTYLILGLIANSSHSTDGGITMPADNTITEIILSATACMEQGDVDEAAALIAKGLLSAHDNYELYFMRALCREQQGEPEAAYYDYRLAEYLAVGSEDEPVIHHELERMSAVSAVDTYKLGKALEQLVLEQLGLHEYNTAHGFLSRFIYDKNRYAARINLTEENMLLSMMLEIWQCEKGHIAEGQGVFERYGDTYTSFRDVFYRTRLYIRRVWFGFSREQQLELVSYIDEHDISCEMLAVLVKYSVHPDYWVDAFDRLSALFSVSDYKYSEHLKQYGSWLSGQPGSGREMCTEPDAYDNGARIIELDYRNSSVRQMQPDYSKIGIIFCTNDDLYKDECIMYLKRLYIPEDMKLDIIVVENAPGMAAGYNRAMGNSDAEYKVYIHHDTFIIDRDILTKIVNRFSEDADIGMLGNAGTTRLPSSARWFDSDRSERRANLYQDILLDIYRSVSDAGLSDDAEGIDGIFMATSRDIPWREDIFDGWHYYDISQTYEFRKAGLKTKFLTDPPVALLHETTTRKDPNNLYEKYGEIFKANYLQNH